MSLESELRKELRNTKLRTAILSAIQLAGIITVGAMAPKVLTVLNRELSPWSEKNMRSALSRLQGKGLVHVEKGAVSITAKGIQYLNTAVPRAKRPKRWDRKWRVVIFDIPEKKKLSRNKLRQTLNEIGFLRLQNSVWVHPFECEELIVLLKTNFHVGKEVLYLIVDKLENDSTIRHHFGLD